MLGTPENPIEWASLYADLAVKGNVPYASSQTIDSVHSIFQAMYLDLADIKRTLAASGESPEIVTLYADVLNIPAGTTWLAHDAMLIYARRVQVGPGATVHLDYRSDQVASLVLFCSEIQGTVEVVATTEQEGQPHPAVFPISVPPETGGVQVHAVNGMPVQSLLTWAQGISTTPTDVFQQTLTTEFIYASLLIDEHPAIALGQLAWTKNWSAQSPVLEGLLFRSASLLTLLSSQVEARSNGATFVPYLTRQVYTELATAFVSQATQYETEYGQLSTQKLVTDEFISSAKALLDNQTYQSQYADVLQAQAKTNYENAVAAVQVSETAFAKAQNAARLVKIDFEDVGIPAWIREKIKDAIVKLGTAVITFGVGIGEMLLGDGAAGAASAGAAVEGAQAVEQTAKAGSEIAKLAKELSDTMKQLKKLVEALEKVYNLSKELVAAAGDIEHAQAYATNLKNMNVLTDGTDLSATYMWQVYQLNADATLQGPIDQGVEYAKQLKLAVDAVAIYGQALAAAQLSAIQAGQQYSQAVWRHQLSQQQQQRLEQEVDSLETGEQPTVSMMQQLYLRYIDAKSSLFAAIEGYRASYMYWALQQSPIEPSIIESVEGLDNGLASLTKIALDNANALSHFSPAPQSLTSKSIVIDDPTVLGALRQSATTSWNVGLDASTFEGFGRVRLSCVRIWLEGAKPTAGHAVNIIISTLGSYLDRLDGSNYQFMSKPLQRDFTYTVSDRDGGAAWKFEDGSFGDIEVDGSVDKEVSYAYFAPTPFAQWSIDLTKHNPGLDLSGVTKITIEFAGSVIPETSTARAQLTGA